MWLLGLFACLDDAYSFFALQGSLNLCYIKVVVEVFSPCQF
jgi:hypothetical protein